MNGPRTTSLLTSSRKRQRGLSLPEIMLGLSLIAVVTASGIIAYNQVAPRVRVNTLMAGLNPAMVDVTQFIQFRYQFGQAEATSGAGATGGDWGASVVPDGGAGGVCSTASALTATDCAGLVPPGTWTAVQPQGNPNYVQFGNMPTFQMGEGQYDTDTIAEWHVPVGSSVGVEVAFQINGTGSTNQFADESFARCGPVADNAVYMIFAVESGAVCETLWTQIQGVETVSQAWCDVDYDFSTFTNTDGEAAVHACITSR